MEETHLKGRSAGIPEFCVSTADETILLQYSSTQNPDNFYRFISDFFFLAK